MANLQDLTKRIKSVKNTRKITRAMEMVAAAKLRKAQERIEQLRPYADAMVEMTARITTGMSNPSSLPLLEKREPKSVAILVFTGDRGLAGALNANVIRRTNQLAEKLTANGSTVHYVGVGKKGVGTLQFQGKTVDQAFRGITDNPQYRDAEAIAQNVSQTFTDKTYDQVIMVYNTFESAMTQQVVIQDLLPLSDDLIGTPVSHLAQEQAGGALAAPSNEATIEEDGHSALWFFEPSMEELLNRLLPTYVEQAIYRALLESTASEHGARMTAMRSATDNAGDMIDTLTLKYNRARQAAITQEILEVVGGAEALT